MTTFDALESSVESSRPIELYEFVKGTEEFRYTSAEDDLTPAADTFTATPIARGAIIVGSDASVKTLTVTLPGNNSLAQEFLTVPPIDETELTIYRYQRDEVPAFNTPAQIYKGIIQSCRFVGDGTVAEFGLRSIEYGLLRNMPRFTFMGMCNHILYDNGCTVSITGNSHIGTVTAGGASTTVTISGLNASGIDLTGGYVTPVGVNDYRTVLQQSGDVVTILLPFVADTTGLQVQGFRGCDHTLDGDCITQYSNEINFGGFHWVPNKNIFQTGLD